MVLITTIGDRKLGSSGRPRNQLSAPRDFAQFGATLFWVIVEHFAVGPLECNCVILGDEASRQAIVVDPGGDHALIIERLHAHDLTCTAIVHTHAHFDHVWAAAELQKATGAPLMIHELDLPLYRAIQMQLDMVGLRMRAPAPRDVDRFLRENDTLSAGAIEVGVLHTPGHTPGSLSFLVHGERSLLLAGDTLFCRGIGRTDLWGGDQEAILASIRTKLMCLPEPTVVVPGHGPSTTIGEELRLNPFLQ